MGATAAVHPADPILQAYGLGKLDDVSSTSVSQHLEGCDSCQRRVAELSSDEFLGRLQQAKVMPDKPAAGWSSSATSSSERTPGPVVPPLVAGTMPPGLADHPGYEVIRELGRGGMGVVYLVRNKLMERLEVLKVVGGHLVERPGVRVRFLREVQSAAKLQHKNIVTAYSAMELGKSIVLVMEYVQGDDLAKVVKSGGPMSVINACYFIYQAALGLQHAHERGMVHRDIKPANLILARDGKKAVVKVLDFGLAKMTSEGQADSGLTREGQMLGTPDYVAPEQIRNAQSADIRADIYSLGCTFYYLLTGGPPFRGDHVWDVYQAHFSMDAGPLNLVRPEVPVELAALVAKMMAKEPGRRFQTPGEVAQALMPFFKKASATVPAENPEISQVGRPEATWSAPGPVPVPEWPAINRTPSPASEARTPTKPRPSSILEGLIDLGETEPLFDRSLDTRPAAAPGASRRNVRPWSTAAEKLSRSGPWAWLAAVGVLLLGVVVVWAAGVIRVKTANGMIELVNLPKDAEVLVDGEEVAVKWPGGGKPAVVTVTPGTHKIVVNKDGVEISGEELTVHAEGTEKFTVRFVSPPKLPNEPSKDGGAESTLTVKDDAHPDAGPAVKTKRVTSPTDGPQPSATEVRRPDVLAAASPAPTERIPRFRAYVWWGVWRISGSDVVIKRTGSHSMVLLTGSRINLEDFTLEAEVQRTEGTGQVELHAGGDIYRTFGFHGKSDHLMVSMKNFAKGERPTSPDPKPMGSFDPDNWVHLKIEKKGQTIVYSLDHKEIFREPNDQMTHGFLALATVGANAKFRNIKATGAGGRVLAEGLPDLPKMEE